jgi:GNAT superfamily N-acetyltransferase
MATNLSQGKIVETDSLSCHHTFPTNPIFKGVWRSRLTAKEADTKIDQILAWFKAQNAKMMFWWTGPGTSPADLGQRLQARNLIDMQELQHELAGGIHQTEQGAPGMVADLDQLNVSQPVRTPPVFEIAVVTTETELYDFINVFIETYEIPDWAGQSWVDATLSLGIGKTPWRIYVGYLGGEAAAISILFNGGGVASVYAVATLPEMQRKGMGAAITLKPLIAAREMGHRYGVLFSTELGGLPIYQRIGFQLTDCRINRYLWRNT